MGYTFSQEDLDFLISDSGQEALQQAEEFVLTSGSMLADLTRLRRICSFPAAVAETVRLRRAAVTKLGGQASRWLLTDEALQQAAPLAVAEHRARRLSGLAVHDLTCSIGADLGALAMVCSVALGSDLDPIRIRMAKHNLAESGAQIALGDATRPMSAGLLPYADPARRTAGGRRITSTDTIPSLAQLDRAWGYRPPILRMPPGVDYDTVARPGEVEIVSLDGGAREAVLWPVECAEVSRRATVLSSAGNGYQVTDLEPDEVTVAPVGQWIVDPDPAVVRAHLVRHYAARHGLWQLDPHLAYLTGDSPPPGTRSFQVIEFSEFRERTIVDWLHQAGAGTVEIKVRGLVVDPDELRVRLRRGLIGPKSVARTIVLARVGRSHMAYLTIARAA